MHRGATKSSRTAGKQGFYAQVLREAEQGTLAEAAAVDGIDDEIALLRLRIRELVRNDPSNLELQMSAINTLARLLKTRYQLSAEQKNSLKQAVLKVLTDVAIPLGIKFIPGAK